jgi:hypothetical protein
MQQNIKNGGGGCYDANDTFAIKRHAERLRYYVSPVSRYFAI